MIPGGPSGAGHERAGPGMNRRGLAGLVAGAAVAMACYFLVARPPGFNAYLIFYLGTPAIALSFLAATCTTERSNGWLP